MRYKVLKSVAHNVGHTFASTLNYWHDDYAMGHLAKAALSSGTPELRVDLLTGEASPPELLVPPNEEIIKRLVGSLGSLMLREGVPPSTVTSGQFRLRFDLPGRHIAIFQSGAPVVMIPYELKTVLVDDRGKQFVSVATDEWPLKGGRPPKPRLRWWQLWKRAV